MKKNFVNQRARREWRKRTTLTCLDTRISLALLPYEKKQYEKKVPPRTGPGPCAETCERRAIAPAMGAGVRNSARHHDTVVLVCAIGRHESGVCFARLSEWLHVSSPKIWGTTRSEGVGTPSAPSRLLCCSTATAHPLPTAEIVRSRFRHSCFRALF
jgi:hypothetical protein